MRCLRRVCVLPLGLGLLLAFVTGCPSGPVKGQVRGKVTFEDQPVTEGRVTFSNNKEGIGQAEAKIESDGTFEVAGGVVVGDYVIVVEPLMELKDTDPGKSPPAPTYKKMPNIPEKYRMQGSTPLKETVKAGKNEFHLKLSK